MTNIHTVLLLLRALSVPTGYFNAAGPLARFFSLHIQPSSHIPGVEALHFTIGDFESLHFFSEDCSLLLIPRSVASVPTFFFVH